MRRCESCETADEPCLPPPRKRIRLKAVHSVIEQPRSSGQSGREISFVYGGDHVWVDFRTPVFEVQFVHGNDNDEDSSDVQSSVAIDEDEGAFAHPVNVHVDDAETVGGPIIGAAVGSYATKRSLSFGRTSASGTSQFASSPTYLVSPVQHHCTPSSQIQVLSPSTSAVLYEAKPLWPLNNLAEAELLRHFIDNIGPQLDVTDHVCHFTTTVPQRAAHCPLLFYAIIAAASIHRSRVQGLPDQFYEEYQAKCIRILIRFLDDPDYSPDENFLAAIVVLRKGEEMSDEDRMCHLLGSSRVINSVGEVAANGGLGESAAWLVLRQSIYVSLTSNTPLNVNLGCYKRSSVFLGLTDHAWANKIVFVFAETLAYSAKSNGHDLTDVEDWHTLQHAAKQWYLDKPDTFLPVFETPIEEDARNEHTTNEFRNPFPTISMLQAPHVIGLMYYHLTLILLALSDPTNTARWRGLDSIRLWREMEQKVRVDLKRCIGLAISNPHVVAANFEASHILYACGHCLNSPGEQEAAVDFLRSVRVKLGWGIDHIIDRLKRHWASMQ
ncbi:hypothetical protein AYL99_07176 [Fonsecaea erecta]|uniref:Transcription factor domain-containing protein n=1 Tax=Fonsecaea erecta TaxID=1367422 RepID=A0A178ZF27_9EURO|nr:hypothetical protein AYL99_07176 [Fonsecaea erecta]OAP58086.1 hypothetical protein AYL99_07176 [Fonsecaea erecta]